LISGTKKKSGSDNLRHSVEAQPRMGSAKMLKRCFGYLKRCQAKTGKLRPNRKGAAVPMGKFLSAGTSEQTIRLSAIQCHAAVKSDSCKVDRHFH
jgi:hypothetical protein